MIMKFLLLVYVVIQAFAWSSLYRNMININTHNRKRRKAQYCIDVQKKKRNDSGKGDNSYILIFAMTVRVISQLNFSSTHMS